MPIAEKTTYRKEVIRVGLNLPFLAQIAKGIAKQFGDNCEVVVHDLTKQDLDESIVLIENGHVTNRKLGDGPSHAVLNALKGDLTQIEDHLGYLTKTTDGRILKSSTIFLRNDQNPSKIDGILSINYDITGMLLIEQSVKSLVSSETDRLSTKEPERITQNVNDLLDDLLDQSVTLVGKPVALMTKEDKVAAIQFLNDAGAFLITKSGDKVSNYFGISKYTLYSYIGNK